MRVDATVVMFSTVVTFAVAMIAGIVPGVALARRNHADLVRAVQGVMSPSGGRALRRVLVIVQTALAVTVIAAAGLLSRSLLRLQSVDVGMPADRLVFVDLALPQAKYADPTRHAAFLDEVMQRLQTTRDIAAATPVNVPPFAGEGGWDVPRFTAEGQSADRAATNPSLNLESIHPNYFETFAVPLVAGRAFAQGDRRGALEVAIVSADVAARTWPGQDPIGKRIKMGGPESRTPWYTVVGVAAPTRYRELTDARPTLYLPAAQFQMTAQMLALRTTASVALSASLARDAVRQIDADVQVVRVASFDDLLDLPLARPRFNASVLAVFAATAWFLAGIGVYGVMASHVRQQRREVAIRLALGASGTQVRRLVLTDGLRLAIAGVLIGAAGAAVIGGLVRGLVFGLQPLDSPLSVIAAALMLLSVAALASIVPARQATRLDPWTTLRGQ